jgi:hypothetical protein
MRELFDGQQCSLHNFGPSRFLRNLGDLDIATSRSHEPPSLGMTIRRIEQALGILQVASNRGRFTLGRAVVPSRGLLGRSISIRRVRAGNE